jgi:hypothetical protein
MDGNGDAARVEDSGEKDTGTDQRVFTTESSEYTELEAKEGRGWV